MSLSAREQVAQLVRAALEESQRRGDLPAVDVDDLAIERPQKPEHGDFASSLPLKLARVARTSPMSIAERLASGVATGGLLEKVWAQPPGFINFSIEPAWLASQVDEILQAGSSYGDASVGAGRRVQVEFVSVNPTGPLHVGHARGAVIGSALANVLEAAGFEVQREYYVNDAGTQMDLFYESAYARYLQALGRDSEVPENGYQGDYIVDLAAELKQTEGDRFLDLPEAEGVAAIGEIALGKMLDSIRDDLELLKIRMDVWFMERSLFDDGQYETAMGKLEAAGHLLERDGAVWFASSALGEDKDNVVVRSTGAHTYFASDIAYHYNKFAERGFDRVIDVWGADHQGHVPRMKAVLSALGIPPERLTLIITQLVTFKRENEVVRVSKRTGDLVTLRELVDEVGVDACRYFFLSRSPESQMEFDMELAKAESSENPVYYVQYAHARICSILELALERKIDFGQGDTALLTHEAELALIRKMLLLPELIENIADSLEPHHLPHYAVEVATAFHWFYQQCRVVSSIPEDLPITMARLKLSEAAKIVLGRCLSLMLMSAPERM